MKFFSTTLQSSCVTCHNPLICTKIFMTLWPEIPTAESRDFSSTAKWREWWKWFSHIHLWRAHTTCRVVDIHHWFCTSGWYSQKLGEFLVQQKSSVKQWNSETFCNIWWINKIGINFCYIEILGWWTLDKFGSFLSNCDGSAKKERKHTQTHLFWSRCATQIWTPS